MTTRADPLGWIGRLRRALEKKQAHARLMAPPSPTQRRISGTAKSARASRRRSHRRRPRARSHSRNWPAESGPRLDHCPACLCTWLGRLVLLGLLLVSACLESLPLTMDGIPVKRPESTLVAASSEHRRLVDHGSPENVVDAAHRVLQTGFAPHHKGFPCRDQGVAQGRCVPGEGGT